MNKWQWAAIIFVIIVAVKTIVQADATSGPDVNTMAQNGLVLWHTVGSFQDPSIEVRSVDTAPEYQRSLDSMTASYAWTDGNCSQHVVIWVWHRYFDQLTAVQQQNVMDHEVGHGICLQHVADPDAIMNRFGDASIGGPSISATVTQADREEFLRYHPQAQRPLLRRAFSTISVGG